MYDFELKVKVSHLYEILYQDAVKDIGRDGVISERFTDWSKLREFAYGLKGKKILQVLEIKDMTRILENNMSPQTKD